MIAPIVTSFVIAAIFGFGLSVSEMIDPVRVIGFLDVTGRWDPTLLLVMAGALAITLPAYHLILRRAKPFLDKTFSLPTKSQIDRPLVLGAAIFGIGWGLGGFCPGPALASLATGSPAVILFVLAMIAGQWLAGHLEN